MLQCALGSSRLFAACGTGFSITPVGGPERG